MDRKERQLIEAVRDQMAVSFSGGRRKRVIAAVSGGADSMCLLEILALLAPQMGFDLLVAHVNHGIRGKEADEDEAFVRRQCALRKLPFYVKKEDVPALAKKEHLSEEAAGRTVRYAFFRALLQKEGAGWIATAHNQGDAAETFLFHLCRGSGLQGLSGIAEAEGDLIRPLIHVSRGEIEQFLEKRGIPFVEDATNRERKYTRNRIRGEVLPLLEAEINPRTQEHILQTAAQIATVQSYIRAQARKIYLQAKRETGENGERSLSLFLLEKEPDFLRREVYLLALEDLFGDRYLGRKDITRRQLEAVDLLGRRKSSAKELQLPAGVAIRKEYGALLFYRRRREEGGDPSSQQPKKAEEEGLRLETEALRKGEMIHASFHDYRITAYTDFSYEREDSGRYTNCFDYAIIKSTVFFRYRKEGDFFSLNQEGSKHKEIRKWMTDEKIPARMRDRILLMADGNHVLWIPGYRTDAEVLKSARQAGRFLHIRIEKEINGGEDQGTDFK